MLVNAVFCDGRVRSQDGEMEYYVAYDERRAPRYQNFAVDTINTQLRLATLPILSKKSGTVTESGNIIVQKNSGGMYLSRVVAGIQLLLFGRAQETMYLLVIIKTMLPMRPILQTNPHSPYYRQSEYPCTYNA